MPRRILDKILPHHATVSEQWFLRPFRALLHDPALWATHRRNVLRAVAVGILVSFVPFPVHTAMSAILALYLRINIPVAIVASWFANPLTMGPLYYAAYRVGVLLLGSGSLEGEIDISLDDLAENIDDIMAPLLLGCLILGVACAAFFYGLLNWLWIRRLRRQYGARFNPSGRRGR